MSFHSEARRNAYDVVVIGSGIGGLSAAALLARHGRRVLVVERHSQLGGYAHSFRRGGQTFDAALFDTSGCEALEFGQGALVDDVLRALHVRDRVRFVPSPVAYTAVFPGLRIDAPVGLPQFIAAHAERFPDQERALRTFLRLCTLSNRELFRLPVDATRADVLADPDRFPVLARYGDATLSQVLDDHFTDDRLKAVLGAQWVFLGVPPSRLSFARWSSMVVSYLHTGTYQCVGGFQRLVDAFADALRRDGGEVLPRSSVRRIEVAEGRVAGVRLENGQRISAPVVISNADALMTLEDMVGAEHLPGDYLGRVRGLRRSLSAVTAYFSTDLDLGAVPGLPRKAYLFDSWDHDHADAVVRAGGIDGMVVSIPSLINPALAPQGRHVIAVMCLADFGATASWRDTKPTVLRALKARLERAVPELAGHLLVAEVATPRTMERYTLNAEGAVYGWEHTPDQTGYNRLGRTTPVGGLYLSGHWTQPGAGLVSVLLSGVETSAAVLGHRDIGGVLGPLAARAA